MKQYCNQINIIINTNNNKKEMIMDCYRILHLHHTCVYYVSENEVDNKPTDIGMMSEDSSERSLKPYNDNIFISCGYIDTGSVLKCTECVSPRVVVGLRTMLGTHPRELLCGTNAYDLLTEGWVDENVTSQHDGGLVDPTPSTRKGTLNLDEDVDNAINVSSNAVVSVGKIKVVF